MPTFQIFREKQKLPVYYHKTQGLVRKFQNREALSVFRFEQIPLLL